MMLLCGQSNQIWHYWSGKYPNRVGHLFGPRNMSKQALRRWMPFACDNDAYIAHTQKEVWSGWQWQKMLDRVKASKLAPLWVLVPDSVMNRTATINLWKHYSPVAKRYGWPLAFCVQDGMSPGDVPSDCDVVFVGGSTKFKWQTIKIWVGNFPRVHVGRVNTLDRLWLCQDLGVESVDGTGWFREPSRYDKIPALESWLEGKRNRELFDHDRLGLPAAP